MSYKINGNHFEQYGRKKNLEITGIPGGKSFMNDPY